MLLTLNSIALSSFVLVFSKLYWVDAWSKNVMISRFDGVYPHSLINVASNTGDNPIFGLVVKGNTGTKIYSVA